MPSSEELVAWIDDGALAIGWVDGAPYGGLVLAATDVDVAQRRLDQLATFAGPRRSTRRRGERRHAGRGRRVRHHDPIRSSGRDRDADVRRARERRVQYAITDDRVLVGVGEAFVPRVLGLDPADSLAASQRFTDAVAELGGPESAALTWLDLAGTYAAVEEALGPSVVGEMDAWLEPLDQVVSVTLRDGDLLIQRAALLVD